MCMHILLSIVKLLLQPTNSDHLYELVAQADIRVNVFACIYPSYLSAGWPARGMSYRW